jgi:hypothetical protein
LKNPVDQMDLTDLHRTFYPTSAEYTVLSNAHSKFSNIEHIIGHQISLNKFKEIEIIPNNFSKQNGMKLDIYNIERKQ